MGIQVWIGILLAEVRSDWGLSYISEALVPNSLMIGLFIGSYFWGIIADKHGRIFSYKQNLLYIAGGCILGAFAPDIWMLSASYIITGFGIGGSFTVDGTVFREHSPAEKSYLLVALSIFTPIGSALPPGLAWIYSYSDVQVWRYVQGSLGLIALVLAIPRLWIKETPLYLISKIEREKEKEKENENQAQVIGINSDQESPDANFKERSSKELIFTLFRKPLRKYTVLYILIWSGICFTSGAINSFLPEVLKRSGFENSEDQIYEVIFYEQIGI